MNTHNFENPLWIISFDNSSTEATSKQRAHFYNLIPAIKSSSEERHLALDFLERMNTSFQEITESYLEEAELDETRKPQAEEIRKKFKSLELWIKWLRNWQKKDPDKDQDLPL